MYYSELAIEVTRRCNMGCAHCLRGEAENLNMPDEYLERFFEHVEGVGCITFTGGEPTLNLWTIEHTLDICKKRNIPVDSFYIVTNGKVVTREFLYLAIDWTLYCMESYPDTVSEGLSGITISRDMFHDKINQKNIDMLKTLAVYRDGDKDVDWTQAYMYELGRARKLAESEEHVAFKSRRLDGVEVSRNYVDSYIALTCTGHILPDCDYEYGEEDDIAIGKATSDAEMNEYIKYMKSLANNCEAA